MTFETFAAFNVEAAVVFPAGGADEPSAFIDAIGVYPLEPGDYIAYGIVDDEQVTDIVEFTIEACATADPTSTGVPTPPDTAVTVEPAPPPSGGGSVGLVLAVLVGIAGTTTLLTVRRSRR